MSDNYKRNFLIGEIYLIDFEGSGSEQTGKRPGVIFQNNTGNFHSPNIIALPLTSSLKKVSMPTHVLLRANETGLLKDSMVLCENPVCISKSKVGQYLTTLSPVYMEKIAIASLIATSAIAFIKEEIFLAVKKTAVELNTVA